MTCATTSSHTDFTGTVPVVARGQAAVAPKFGFGRLDLMLRVWNERKALQRLDDAALKDIGLSRADVEREASRSLVDVPAHRL